jgi:hypothetical protein
MIKDHKANLLMQVRGIKGLALMEGLATKLAGNMMRPPPEQRGGHCPFDKNTYQKYHFQKTVTRFRKSGIDHAE